MIAACLQPSSSSRSTDNISSTLPSDFSGGSYVVDMLDDSLASTSSSFRLPRNFDQLLDGSMTDHSSLAVDSAPASRRAARTRGPTKTAAASRLFG